MTYPRNGVPWSSRILVAAAALVWLASPGLPEHLSGVPSAAAQDPDIADLIAPPHLSVVDGAATLDRDGVIVSAEAGQILAAGDRVSTGGGRVEILFGDGTALHLDRSTTLDLLDEDLLRLVEGRAYLHVAPSDPPFEYRVDTPAASIRTAVAGEYRIVAGALTELAVARGFASIATTAGSLALRSGEAIQVRAGDAPGFVMPFNAAAWDPFDRWSQDRRRPRVTAITSAPLQGHLTAYNATLSHHGTWSHHHDHGHVWYPHVPAGWRPFYNGRWTTLAPYGWTWFGADPWAWPTHYYGQWGVTTAGAWFWIPGTRWRPAAVHWTVTTTHVGWVPWGHGGIDIFGFTVIPRSVFHINVIVPRHAVRVTHSTLRPLVVAASPPLPGGVAVPRAFGSQRRPAIVRRSDGGVFASDVQSGADDRQRGVPQRVAQPRRGPSAFVESAVGERAPARRADEQIRVPPAGSDRRAVERFPVTTERQQAPLREQPALRDQPALGSPNTGQTGARAVGRQAEPRAEPRRGPSAFVEGAVGSRAPSRAAESRAQPAAVESREQPSRRAEPRRGPSAFVEGAVGSRAPSRAAESRAQPPAAESREQPSRRAEPRPSTSSGAAAPAGGRAQPARESSGERSAPRGDGGARQRRPD